MEPSKKESFRRKRVARLRIAASVLPDPAGRKTWRLDVGHWRFRCSIGGNGMVRLKREGDGCSPIGRFAILSWRLRPDAPAGVRPPDRWRMIRAEDGWCDDIASGAYNREIRLPASGRHERMWRGDRKYDVVAVLDFNIRPRVIGRGSAIFFHLCSAEYEITAGCVALTANDMRKLIPQLAGRAIIQFG